MKNDMDYTSKTSIHHTVVLSVLVILAIGLVSSAAATPVAIELQDAPVRGPQEAPITVVEFSDFQCPFCARVSPTIHQLVKQYPGQVKWIFKHFLLGFHPDALLAHQAALAAGEQGKFWAMHDLLFAHQRALKREDLIQYAKQLGLDRDRFLDALDSGKYRTIVEQDKAEGARLGVRGTPTFFINGRRLVGAQPFSAFASLIEKELRRLKVQTGADIEDRSGGISAKGPRDAPGNSGDTIRNS